MATNRACHGQDGAAGVVSIGERFRDERGAAVAEFVVALPILVSILFGVVILGKGLATKTAVMAAARVAAREYAVTGIHSRAVEVAKEELRGAGFTVTHSNPTVETSRGGFAVVTVTYRLRLPNAGSSLPGVPPTWDISGQAVFRAQ